MGNKTPKKAAAPKPRKEEDVAPHAKRFAAAVAAEETAFKAAASGDQLKRVEHFNALQELAAAHAASVAADGEGEAAAEAAA